MKSCFCFAIEPVMHRFTSAGWFIVLLCIILFLLLLLLLICLIRRNRGGKYAGKLFFHFFALIAPCTQWLCLFYCISSVCVIVHQCPNVATAHHLPTCGKCFIFVTLPFSICWRQIIQLSTYGRWVTNWQLSPEHHVIKLKVEHSCNLHSVFSKVAKIILYIRLSLLSV